MLRAGINVGNPLLVTGEADSGDPVGLAPDVARAIAIWLGVDVQYVTFPTPSAIAEQAGLDKWDVALIADEPARARRISFTPSYVEIPATYLVHQQSDLRRVSQVDQAGTTIGTIGGAAFALYLSRTLGQAELFTYADNRELLQALRIGQLDAIAGLRVTLDECRREMTDFRLLADDFTAVKQAVGLTHGNPAVTALSAFIEQMKADGHIDRSIAAHGVKGLAVSVVA